MTTTEAPGPRPVDQMYFRACTSRFTVAPASLPISFVYGGQARSGIPSDWHPTSERRRLDANLVETIFEGTDPQTGLALRVEWLAYADFPVVEWTAWFTNTGSQPAPILKDVLALDAGFGGAAPVLHHSNGDFYSETGYTSQATPMPRGAALDFAPTGGRPCDGAFPYYRLQFVGAGVTLAVGWPGQWAASFEGTKTGVRVRAGQQRLHLSLLPGETIRTPRITLLAYAGGAARGINLWRRWYLAHVLPRPDGQPLTPKLAVCGPEEGEEFTAATEENQLRNIEKFKQLGVPFDVWWIDAGWYSCPHPGGARKWWMTGTWEPDPERFPNGLKPVSDRAAAYGADLLTWFEPERVRPGTQLDREHPEWLLRSEKAEAYPSETDHPENSWWLVKNRLLNLGDPQAREWLTEHVCRLIKDNGIKIYRQDFNFEPLDHWRTGEAEDRQGVRENLHVQGYLKYWDDLLARNPGLWIDSCSSGGRRNDLETMRRSVPLHYTDYGYGVHPVKLDFHRTLYEWIPYFKESTLSWDLRGPERFDPQVDSFSFHCGMAPMMFATLDIRRDDYDFALALKLIEIWRRAAGFLLHGDCYRLTPAHRSAAEWVAWQFDRPESGDGLIQAFRLPDCAAESLTVYPQALRPDAAYRFENPEAGETRDVSGSALLEHGLTVALPRRGAAAWFYCIQS